MSAGRRRRTCSERSSTTRASTTCCCRGAARFAIGPRTKADADSSLTTLADGSALDFGPEQNLLIDKLGVCMPWFVNARMSHFHDDAPASALRCAAALQDDIGALHDALDENGLPRVEFGIGVHRGPVTTAHVGTIDRRQYSAIGDTVNVGSRLCGVAGAGELVVSAIAAQHLGSACSSRLEPAEDVELKGVAGRVPILRLRASHHDPVS